MNYSQDLVDDLIFIAREISKRPCAHPKKKCSSDPYMRCVSCRAKDAIKAANKEEGFE